MTALRSLASLLVASAALLAGCTSSPSPSPNVVDPLTITVQPAALAIYPGVPATLLITGGTGSYVVASNNQAIVPITTAGVGHQLTVVANPVNADTTVILSIRDTSTATPTTATLTVRPGTIANSVSVTPVTTECNTPAPNSGQFLCSGNEALVTATISQAGQLLPARTARFDVVSGDVRFIVTPPGTGSEVLALSTTAVSDQNGLVRVRLRALPGAPNQNALIQITDPETGAFQRVVVPIVQLPGPGGAAFFAVPTSITFTGPFIGRCAPANTFTTVVIFGGTPPYNVVNANGVIGVTPAVVTQSGGSFRAQTISDACFTDAPITITDSAGRTIVVTISNQEGTQAAPAPAIVLAPDSITLGCGQSASFVASGGGTNATISASSNNGSVTVAVTDRTVTVTRAGNPPALGGPPPPSTQVTITATDGSTSDTATVTVPTTCS